MMPLGRAVVLTLLFTSLVPGRGAARPHVLFTLADDIGWNNVGWHAKDNAAGQGGEVVTPTLDELVKEGIELDRYMLLSLFQWTPTASLTKHGLRSIP